MMANTEEAQQKIALLYAERNRLYERLPAARLILNLGAGSGSFSRRYLHSSSFILCIDRCEKEAGYPAWGPAHKGFGGFTQFAQLAADGRSVSVKAELLDALPLLPPKTFDLVVMGQLIEHFNARDLELLLHEAGRVLVPEGLLQIDTVTEILGEDTHGHEQRFTLRSLQDAIERAALTVVEIFPFAKDTALWAIAKRST